NRHVVEFRPGALLDCGNHQVAQIGVGTAEVEMKLNLLHRLTISRGRDGFPARRSTHHEAGCRVASKSRRPRPASSAANAQGSWPPLRPPAPLYDREPTPYRRPHR